jgi:hypothetical protein
MVQPVDLLEGNFYVLYILYISGLPLNMSSMAKDIYIFKSVLLRKINILLLTIWHFQQRFEFYSMYID